MLLYRQEKYSYFQCPDQDMLLVTGILTQTYTYIEFNLRRCVQTFVHGKLLTGPWARKPTLIQSAKLVGVLKSRIRAQNFLTNGEDAPLPAADMTVGRVCLSSVEPSVSHCYAFMISR